MKPKIPVPAIVLAIAIVAILVSAGYFTLTNHLDVAAQTYHLGYDFKPMEWYSYQITYSNEEADEPIIVYNELLITDANPVNFMARSIINLSDETLGGETVYNMTSDTQGRLIATDTNVTIPISEFKPEMPNQLAYPEKVIQVGDSWTNTYAKTGCYDSYGIITEYEARGSVHHILDSVDNITVNGRWYECAVIKSEVTYIINTTQNSTNGVIWNNVTCMSQGTDFVDLKKGFLVQSIYDINQTIDTDLTDVYKKKGLFNNFHRITPQNVHVTNELMNVQ
jgi:hypothetical protein